MDALDVTMDRNPYAPPKANTEPAPPEQRDVLYAKLSVRFRAVLIDYFLMLGSLLLVAALGARFEQVEGLGAALFVSWVALAIAYEPVMVWRTGGTIGHHVKNICVVSERTGGHPTLFAAFVRSLVKALLGWLSAANILISDRHQALHDAAVKATVRIRNQKAALPRDYVRAPRR
jgi:uncharacterized RDD family membrane protein YckC